MKSERAMKHLLSILAAVVLWQGHQVFTYGHGKGESYNGRELRLVDIGDTVVLEEEDGHDAMGGFKWKDDDLSTDWSFAVKQYVDKGAKK